MEKQNRKLLQSTVYQRTLYLIGEKIRIKFSKSQRKEAIRQQLRQGTFANLDQTMFNGSWLFEEEM